MFLAQEFKTLAGVQKRAAFENAHCNHKWLYAPIRCLNGKPDNAPFNASKMLEYTWRMSRTVRIKAK